MRRNKLGFPLKDLPCIPKGSQFAEKGFSHLIPPVSIIPLHITKRKGYIVKKLALTDSFKASVTSNKSNFSSVTTYCIVGFHSQVTLDVFIF